MSMAAATQTTLPTLRDLLAGIIDAPPLAVSDIASDSRRLTSGAVFLACRGATSHALDHLDELTARSLSAVVWDGDTRSDLPAGTPAFVVPDLKSRLALIANRFFADPSAALRVTGITGTNGKTTIAWLLAQCWQRLGQRCAYIGTLGAGIDELSDAQGLTTPDCVELQRLFAGFRDAGAQRVAMEVSSHGLQQGRVAGTHFDAAVFTNLSRDHIDYHGDMTTYGEIKARLFSTFSPRHRVICIDSDFGRALAHRFGNDAIIVASQHAAEITGQQHVSASAVEPTSQGIALEVISSWGNGKTELPLVGLFNVANALEVLALLLADGIELEDALEVLGTVSAPPGRMQPVRIDNAAGAPGVFVDYAHTPAALEAALAALRPHCRGALWCVFGCGGDRDRGKRPLMGRAVTDNADHAVLTSDNPRSESPAAIMREVQEGMTGEVTAIEDRAAAIAWAIAGAGSDDIVLIAGKGHEDYQLVNGKRLPFSDYQAAAENLRRRQ